MKLLGGEESAIFPSSVLFKEPGLLVTVYVHDLVVSGTAENHKQFWKNFVGKVLGEPTTFFRMVALSLTIRALPRSHVTSLQKRVHQAKRCAHSVPRLEETSLPEQCGGARVALQNPATQQSL